MTALEPEFSLSEEISHAVTHGFGFLCAAALTVYLIEEAIELGDALDVLAAIVFGVTLTHVYAASTLCHALPDGWQSQRVFEKLDFTGIYALIAGTYTPFMLGPLRDGWGPVVLAAVWVVAAIGIAIELLAHPRPVRLALGMYLGMGWLGVFTGIPLSEALPTEALWILLGGGTAYTLGVVFYVWRGFRYHHAVWHLFVLLGSGLHAYAVAAYAIPFPLG